MAVIEIPANRIKPGCASITPDLLPLVSLTQDEIDRVVETVSGGARNVQDIYPLAPLQEGMLFHHLTMAQEGDPYVSCSLMSFSTRDSLDAYVKALNAVIARHDILRAAAVWEGLPEPVQVVWRDAPVLVEDVTSLISPAKLDVVEQLKACFNPSSYRIDVRKALLNQFTYCARSSRNDSLGDDVFVPSPVC